MHLAYPEFDIIGESQEDWEAFCEALKAVWLTIPDTLIRRLIHSMQDRINAVIKADGYQTKY